MAGQKKLNKTFNLARKTRLLEDPHLQFLYIGCIHYYTGFDIENINPTLEKQFKKDDGKGIKWDALTSSIKRSINIDNF